MGAATRMCRGEANNCKQTPQTIVPRAQLGVEVAIERDCGTKTLWRVWLVWQLFFCGWLEVVNGIVFLGNP